MGSMNYSRRSCHGSERLPRCDPGEIRHPNLGPSYDDELRWDEDTGRHTDTVTSQQRERLTQVGLGGDDHCLDGAGADIVLAVLEPLGITKRRIKAAARLADPLARRKQLESCLAALAFGFADVDARLRAAARSDSSFATRAEALVEAGIFNLHRTIVEQLRLPPPAKRREDKRCSRSTEQPRAGHKPRIKRDWLP